MPQSFAWGLLLLLPLSVQGQAASTQDLIGPLRADGIARPLLEWMDGSWFVTEYDSTRWEHVDRYRWTDENGNRQWVEADSVVRIAGEGSVYGLIGHRTSLPDPVTSWSSRREYVGYVVSDTVADVPFLRRQSSDTTRIPSLLDSLAPLSNEAEIEIDSRIWQASLGEAGIGFVEAVRSDIGIGPASCFIVHQWRDLTNGSTQLVSSGDDDCEGKGHPRRRPWALLKRGDYLFAFLIVERWDGDTAEIWVRRENGTWSRVALQGAEDFVGEYDSLGSARRAYNDL